MKLLFRWLTLSALAAAAVAAPQAAEPGEASRRPSYERGPGGVIVIRSSGRVPAPGPAEPAPAVAAPVEAPASPAEEVPPRAQDSEAYTYGPGGAVEQSPITSRVRRSNGVIEAYKLLRNINGREMPYLAEREEVIRETANEKTSERRIQRYDPSGRPTTAAVERVEERKLPDGTVETVETLFEEDLNGRLRPTERRTEREREAGGARRTVMTVETAGPSGGFRTSIHEESVERRSGDSRSVVETVRKVDDGAGKLRVAAREEATLTKSGAVSTTEKKVFAANPLTGRMELSERTVGRLTERPDGSLEERVEAYGSSVAGGGSNLNATRPQLQRVVERQVEARADGTTVERESTRARSVVDPSRFEPAGTQQTVTQPTAKGAAVRTDFYEQGVNGRMQPTRTVVTEIEK